MHLCWRTFFCFSLYSIAVFHRAVPRQRFANTPKTTLQFYFTIFSWLWGEAGGRSCFLHIGLSVCWCARLGEKSRRFSRIKKNARSVSFFSPNICNIKICEEKIILLSPSLSLLWVQFYRPVWRLSSSTHSRVSQTFGRADKQRNVAHGKDEKMQPAPGPILYRARLTRAIGEKKKRWHFLGRTLGPKNKSPTMWSVNELPKQTVHSRYRWECVASDI